MDKFHAMLDQLTKRRKNELYALADKETNPVIAEAYMQEISLITEFIYCCQKCVPEDAPLDQAKIEPIK